MERMSCGCLERHNRGVCKKGIDVGYEDESN